MDNNPGDQLTDNIPPVYERATRNTATRALSLMRRTFDHVANRLLYTKIGHIYVVFVYCGSHANKRSTYAVVFL